MKMSSMEWAAWILVVIGAINWGFLGIAGVNMVELIIGTGVLAQVVYILVGLSGLNMLWMGLSKKK